MLTFEAAKAKAKKADARVNNCRETADAFIFGVSYSTDIGDEPIVVMKKDGKILSMTGYLDFTTTPDEIKDRSSI